MNISRILIAIVIFSGLTVFVPLTRYFNVYVFALLSLIGIILTFYLDATRKKKIFTVVGFVFLVPILVIMLALTHTLGLQFISDMGHPFYTESILRSEALQIKSSLGDFVQVGDDMMTVPTCTFWNSFVMEGPSCVDVPEYSITPHFGNGITPSQFGTFTSSLAAYGWVSTYKYSGPVILTFTKENFLLGKLTFRCSGQIDTYVLCQIIAPEETMFTDDSAYP